MDTQKRFGEIVHYHGGRRIGTIVETSEGSDGERFFFHISGVIRGPVVPPVNARVKFLVSDRVPREGQLRTAIGIEIEPSVAAGIAVLAGNAPVSSSEKGDNSAEVK